MRDVKVFLVGMIIPVLKKRLKKHGILIYDKRLDCDVAVVLYGAFSNPLAFRKRILVYWMQNDVHTYTVAFHSLYLPILNEYYDDLIDLTECKSFEEIGDRIAEEVKRLENETA